MAKIKQLFKPVVLSLTMICTVNHGYCNQDDIEAQNSAAQKTKSYSVKKIAAGVAIGSIIAGGSLAACLASGNSGSTPYSPKNNTDAEGLNFIDPIDFAVSPITPCQKVSSVASDFMEQRESDGRYFSKSSDLELPYESNSGGAFDPSRQGFDQVVGVYFPDLGIPRHASVKSAKINFRADEADSGPVSLQINGDTSLPSQDFSFSRATERPLTTSSVTWEPAPWNQVGASYLSSELNQVVQELVDLPAWESGGAMAFTLRRSPTDSTTNTRVAEVDPSIEVEFIPPILARGDYAAVGEGKEQAFDGLESTKWLDFSPTSWIQYNFPISAPRIVTGYSITSANDVPARDPKDWQLLASNDGEYWVLLDERSDVSFESRFDTKSFNFSNTIAYSMYRFIFTENHGSRIIQLAEISFSTDGGVNPEPEDPDANYASGLINTYYDGTWSSLPNFASLVPSRSLQPNPSVVSGIGVEQYRGRNNFGVVQEGYLSLSEEGTYTFKLRSDDGSRLYIDNMLLIDNNGKHPPQDRYGEMSIEAGLHRIRVEFFEAQGGEVLTLEYSVNGRPFVALDPSSLFHQVDDNEPPSEPETPDDPEGEPGECQEENQWDNDERGMTHLESGPLVGHTTHQDAHIWAYAGGRRNISIKYQKVDSCESPRQQEVGTRSGRSDSSVARLRNLSPNSEYRYQFLVDNKLAGQEGVFKTAPEPDKGAKFSYLLASCMRHRDHPTQPAWDKVIEEQPDFHILNGDTIYITSVSRSSHWRIHKLQRGIPNFAEVIRSAPTYSTWDDHDFGENDSDGTKSGKGQVLEAWKDVWANPSFGLPSSDVDGVFYSFKWADVEFFVLDNRYNRNQSVGKSRSKYLGDGQLDWLKEGLINSRAPFKVIVHGGTIDGGGRPGSTKSGSDSSNVNSWAYFPDLEEIYDFIKENQIYGVVWNGGDIHYNSVAHYDNILDYPVVEFISSGIGKHVNRFFTMMEVDTSTADPIIRARHFKKDSRDSSRNIEYDNSGSITQKKEYRLSELTPPGVRDLIVSGIGEEKMLKSGDSYKVSWVTVGDIADVVVEYQIDEGPWVFVDELENNGFYDWQIPSSVDANHVKIRVRDAHDGRKLKSNVSPDVINISSR